METRILKVVKCGEMISVPSEKTENKVLNKRTLVLQELGGRYENQYAASALGSIATLQFYEGDMVAVKLRFQTHEHNGAIYQDVTISDIVKL
jgi:hypothetical protein